MLSIPSKSTFRSRRFGAGLALGAAIVAASACSSSSDSSSVSVPSSATAGFTVPANAFQFSNFATGYSSSIMTPALMVRMFGMADVCADTLVPCTLTPAANAWLNNANASMDGGRCEGFAVLSSLFFLGLASPTNFGGTSARDLVLDGNISLQEEIAYWFSTQNVPEVVSDKTKALYAKDAVSFLATFLQPGTTDYYRIGFVRKTAHGITGGHAVTPTGYEAVAGQPGVYTLHVYDNNFPDSDRTMTLDTNANRWEYHGSSDPTQASADYVGDEANKNPLYFAPIKIREGVLPCPFCTGATESQTVTSGSANVTATDANGNSAGIGADGSVNQTGSGSVQPGFSDIDTWDGSTTTTFVLPAGDTSLSVAGIDPTVLSSVLQLGSGYAVQIGNLSIASGTSDTVKISGGGSSVAYQNTSGTAVTLSTAITLPAGGTLQIQIIAPAGATNVTASINAAAGTLTVSADGTAGQPITVNVTKVGKDGTTQSGSLMATGAATSSISVSSSTWMPGQPLSGTQTNGTTTITLGDSCADGTKDGSETDVDCGGSCSTKCATGKTCAMSSDCTSDACNPTTLVCAASQCTDGVKDGSESDVDCGGTCTTQCAVGKACTADADCTTSACDATMLVCDASQCMDGRKDGTEGDVDCGGACATKCADGSSCGVPADCTSNTCTTSVCESASRKVFLTSATYAANFGGLTQADGDCQTLATAAHLPGTYKAFLSDQTTSAQMRMTMSASPYVRVDGVEIAANAANFFTDGHEAAIDKTEANVTVDGESVWTGSLTSGAADGSQKCASWTSTTLDDSPTVGESDQTSGSWAQASGSSCIQTNHFYCVEQ